MKKSKKFLLLCVAIISCIVVGGGLSLYAFPNSFFHKSNYTPPSNGMCIVIDAGHGGKDPGKVGVGKTLEKDINLLLAQRLVIPFENKGFEVVLTRESDTELSNGHKIETKRSDMNNRLSIVSECNPNLVISIHQNSYPDSKIAGPQVFYYSKSEAGQQLALAVQARLNQECAKDSACANQLREAKANNDYFMLKKLPTPTIIVECGFLSNPAEESLLCTEAYRDRLVRAIYLGVTDYLYQIESVPNS